MFQKAKLQVERLPELVNAFNGALKLIPGESPAFHYTDRKNKNQDSLAMMEKAKEILEGLEKLRG